MSLNLTKLAAIALAGLSLALSGCEQKSASGITPDDMSIGKETAKVTMIEYASVACPICAHFNETVMPDIRKNYIDTGKVRYVYRPMLTGVPSIAASGELLARCAGKDKYFTVVDTIMKAQKEMYKYGEGDSLARPVLLGIAKSLSMSEADFDKCIMDEKGLKHINDLNQKYTVEAQIEGTPTFFINGKKFNYKGGGIAEFDEAFKKAEAAAK